MSFVEGPVSVAVPATSANLGPGFDCLGLALELADTLVGEVVPEGLEVRVAGEGAEIVPLDEDWRCLLLRVVHPSAETSPVAAATSEELTAGPAE